MDKESDRAMVLYGMVWEVEVDVDRGWVCGSGCESGLVLGWSLVELLEVAGR